MTVSPIRRGEGSELIETPVDTPMPLAQPRRITIAYKGYECSMSCADLRLLAAVGPQTLFEIEMKTPAAGNTVPTLKVSSEMVASATAVAGGEVLVMEMKVPGEPDPGPTVRFEL